MLGLNSFSHWIVLLVLVLLVFGTGKLRNVGRDLGGAIADFRKGLKHGQPDETVPQAVRLDVDAEQRH
ncbi:preprotein translocase subunit TatA [Rhodanobacter thiooxydans]|uniref:Sec-independent protein translocase protein TatA n=1 Tax=Rhodanobacter thiooxydans TaxID=416169 RepID=A0A154QJX6_9GAMM|nr:twin-arginine translocase TatA/TatE family subunit [Rhodanobacter thiooxydans]EIM02974.1 twin arginine translocase protein A [Rhodanobacter thiooxydans LCS2]KZC24552.1 preprotein translocase subunit TatA [Rhodanobacter thiooxydans]MCW0203320.1 twin-arginine translocase TatA/TatE family subunit [Rhodanobacter thiooxydans]